MAASLSAADRAVLLLKLPGWRARDDCDGLTRIFSFGDFAEAFAFMTQVALVAQAMDRRPQWCNHDSRVEITVGGADGAAMTQNDVYFARAIDAIYGARGGPGGAAAVPRAD